MTNCGKSDKNSMKIEEFSVQETANIQMDGQSWVITLRVCVDA